MFKKKACDKFQYNLINNLLTQNPQNTPQKRSQAISSSLRTDWDGREIFFEKLY